MEIVIIMINKNRKCINQMLNMVINRMTGIGLENKEIKQIEIIDTLQMKKITKNLTREMKKKKEEVPEKEGTTKMMLEKKIQERMMEGRMMEERIRINPKMKLKGKDQELLLIDKKNK